MRAAKVDHLSIRVSVIDKDTHWTIVCLCLNPSGEDNSSVCIENDSGLASEKHEISNGYL